ncbi:PIG-L family deacetylase [Patescibacteria group bacterium]|nr:PIG-L family deacetylase [Patescibacteria group bacterium]
MERHNLILSPHFDDAVLSLGGLLAKEGSKSTVLTFFAGKPPKSRAHLWDLFCGFLNSDDAIRAREKENIHALESLNVSQSNIVNFSFLGKSYRRWFGASDEKLKAIMLAELLKFIRTRASEGLNIFAPALEVHKDHKLLKAVLLSAVPILKNENIKFFLYQDLPYSYVLPAGKLKPEQVSKKAQLEIITVPLTQSEIAKKVSAIEAYQSQLGTLAMLSGGNLASKIERFASKQASQFDVSTGYCEVLYEVTQQKRSKN